MLTLRTKPGDKVIELGGGACPKVRPNVDVRSCFDEQGNPTVDFTADFNEPLPISSDEFDGVFSQYSLEHISWRKVPQFLGEIFRILKPGGKAVIVTANTEAQLKWIQDHPEGWDGKDSFESNSCVLFGDHDYKENSHASFFSPTIMTTLLQKVGFGTINVLPYGERNTDMLIEAIKPVGNMNGVVLSGAIASGSMYAGPRLESLEGDKSKIFNKNYFHAKPGEGVGGYQMEGYRDFPVHEITVKNILARRPSSVLEIGAARNYLVKKLQDRGIKATGIEVSHHCNLTRAADPLLEWDICKAPWPIGDDCYDLCFDLAFLEHVPEESLPVVLGEMKRTCKRGLHGIDFGARDDGNDKTHCSLHDKSWWVDQFNKHGLHNHEIVDKEELERGEFPPEILRGDGKLKLNIGCFLTQFHYGWTNIDVHDMAGYSQANGYNYHKHDVRNGLPFDTGKVSLIYSSHMIEHLTYDEGLKFLKECRRVIEPGGAMRLIVPDARRLILEYCNEYHFDYSEISDGWEQAPTSMAKLWSLVFSGHQAGYDVDTLTYMLEQAGFTSKPHLFRECENHEGSKQILRETLDVLPCLSLFVDAFPIVG